VICTKKKKKKRKNSKILFFFFRFSVRSSTRSTTFSTSPCTTGTLPVPTTSLAHVPCRFQWSPMLGSFDFFSPFCLCDLTRLINFFPRAAGPIQQWFPLLDKFAASTTHNKTDRGQIHLKLVWTDANGVTKSVGGRRRRARRRPRACGCQQASFPAACRRSGRRRAQAAHAAGRAAQQPGLPCSSRPRSSKRR
jgi:hypothetical protein